MCPRKDPAKKATVWAANCPGKSPILTSKRPQIFCFDGKMSSNQNSFHNQNVCFFFALVKVDFLDLLK
jgi:hypothetical protein